MVIGTENACWFCAKACFNQDNRFKGTRHPFETMQQPGTETPPPGIQGVCNGATTGKYHLEYGQIEPIGPNIDLPIFSQSMCCVFTDKEGNTTAFKPLEKS